MRKGVMRRRGEGNKVLDLDGATHGHACPCWTDERESECILLLSHSGSKHLAILFVWLLDCARIDSATDRHTHNSNFRLFFPKRVEKKKRRISSRALAAISTRAKTQPFQNEHGFCIIQNGLTSLPIGNEPHTSSRQKPTHQSSTSTARAVTWNHRVPIKACVPGFGPLFRGPTNQPHKTPIRSNEKLDCSLSYSKDTQSACRKGASSSSSAHHGSSRSTFLASQARLVPRLSLAESVPRS